MRVLGGFLCYDASCRHSVTAPDRTVPPAPKSAPPTPITPRGSSLPPPTLPSPLPPPRSPINREAGTWEPLPSTTEILTATHVIEEQGVRLRLSLTDTPGFGDQVDNSDCFQPILQHITTQYSTYLQSEYANDAGAYTILVRIFLGGPFLTSTALRLYT